MLFFFLHYFVLLISFAYRNLWHWIVDQYKTKQFWCCCLFELVGFVCKLIDADKESSHEVESRPSSISLCLSDPKLFLIISCMKLSVASYCSSIQTLTQCLHVLIICIKSLKPNFEFSIKPKFSFLAEFYHKFFFPLNRQISMEPIWKIR